MVVLLVLVKLKVVSVMVIMEGMYYGFSFFFASRRRHTRRALVTGVQTCALPIYRRAIFSGLPTVELAKVVSDLIIPNEGIEGLYHVGARPMRSDERRVGNECVSTCRSRWSPHH